VSAPDGVGAFPALAARWIPVLERHRDHEGLAHAYKALARAQFAAGRAGAADEACVRALEQCALGGAPPDGYVLYLRGTALLAGPAPIAEAIAYADERIERADGHATSPVGLLAECAAMTGDFARARELASAYRASFDEQGRVPPVLEAEVELIAGDPVAAERLARPVYEFQIESGDIGHGAGSGLVLSRALLEQGRLEDAAALVDEVSALAPTDDLHAQIEWRAIAGRARGDVRLAREALSLAEGTEWPNVRARARLDVASVASEPERSALVAEAVEIFAAKGNRVEAERAARLS